jgi:hypothetical protein
MRFDSNTILRILRAAIGALIFVVGVMNDNWLAVAGFIIFISGATGRCGFGSSSCEIKPVKKPEG